MSIAALSWARGQKVGNPIGKAVLMSLAAYADEDGFCFPGQAKLAEECECSERVVRKWMAELEKGGLVRRVRRTRDNGSRTSDGVSLNLAQQPARGAEPQRNQAKRDQPARGAATGQPARGAEPTGTKCRANIGQGNIQPLSHKAREREWTAEFETTFWPAYPHKVGKPKALASFFKARQTADLATIMAGLASYVASKPADRSWLNPTTFLNQHRWADQPASQPIRGGQHEQRHAHSQRRSREDDINSGIEDFFAAKRLRNPAGAGEQSAGYGRDRDQFPSGDVTLERGADGTWRDDRSRTAGYGSRGH